MTNFSKYFKITNSFIRKDAVKVITKSKIFFLRRDCYRIYIGENFHSHTAKKGTHAYDDIRDIIKEISKSVDKNITDI